MSLKYLDRRWFKGGLGFSSPLDFAKDVCSLGLPNVSLRVAGKVQEAEGGTLLLDEVGELTADAQARLLRFLNDRTYERLGEARERQPWWR